MNIIFLAIGSNYLGGFTTCMRFRVTIWHIPITVAFVIELLLLFRHLHIVVHFANIFLGFLAMIFRLAGTIIVLGNTVVLCQLWCALWCPIMLGKTILS